MSTRLYGNKIGMTRVYDGDVSTPVTVIQVLPNHVVEVKDPDKHGYAAFKVACGRERRRIKSKSVRGEYQRADVAPRQSLREMPPVDGVAVGGAITVEQLDAARAVDVSAVSKGRGFAGVMRRYNFKGHCASHGTKGHRVPGAIGCRMDPGRVFKNKRMPGHYGAKRITVRNLDIVDVDAERHLVLVKGSVPVPKGGLVSLQQD